MERKTHVHFGAGSFGLGFVGWLAKHAGLNLIVCAPFSAGGTLKSEIERIRSHREYLLEFEDGSTETVGVNDVIGYARGIADQTVTTALLDPSVHLITTAVKPENLHSVAATIGPALAQRSAQGLPPAPIMLCENGADAEQFRAALAGAATEDVAARQIIVPCIVDRVCGKLVERDGRTLLPVEKFGRLYAEDCDAARDLNRRVTDIATATGAVELVSDMGWVTERKYWLLNGPHLLLAATANALGYKSFKTYVNENREFCRRVMDDVTVGMLLIAKSRGRTAQEIDALFDELSRESTVVLERFSRQGDDPSRIAKRLHELDFAKAATVRDFFENLEFKVFAPLAAHIKETGLTPPNTSVAFTFMMFEMMRKVRGEYA